MGDNSKVLLIDEHRSEPLKLVESVATPTGDFTNGVIATLYGVLSDFGHETRNDRWYTEELWSRVFQDPLFNEALRTKTLFGEADHPLDVEDRLETHIPYVSHIVRDPKINHDKKVVEGYLDILDTPNGRIIKTLIDYGCTLGVSSRGSGDLVYNNARTEVDPESYTFITWDIVARPSNKNARVHELDTVDNRTGRTAFESLKEQVNAMVKSRNLQSLHLTESIMSNTDIPDKSEVIKFIRESIDKVEKPQDPEPVFTEEGQDTDKKYLLKDLDDAYERITKLRHQNEELDVRNKDLERSLSDSQDTVRELTDLNKNLSSMVSSYMERLSSSNPDTITEGDSEDQDVLESNDDDDVVSKIVEGLFSKINDSLTGQVKTVNSTVSKLTERIDKYESDRKFTEGFDELSKQLKSSQQEVNRLKKSLSNSQNENIRLIRKISKIMDEYFKVRCNQLGLNESLVRREFTSSRLYEYDLSDIEDVLQEKYSNVGSNRRLNEDTTLGAVLNTANVRRSPAGKSQDFKTDSEDDLDSDDYSENTVDNSLLESIRGVRHQ